MALQSVLILLIIGLAAGMLSGLVGVGGGIIIVPALVFFLGFTQQQAQGTSLGLLLLPVGVLAVYNFYQKGYVDVKVVLLMSISFVLGGWIGSKVALMVPQDTLRKFFSILLLFVAYKFWFGSK